MTSEEELVSAIFAALPTAVARMSEIAANPGAKVSERLTAIELLARVAGAHRTPHSHRVDEVTMRKARSAFLHAGPFSRQVAETGKSAGARSKATKLMALLPATKGH